MLKQYRDCKNRCVCYADPITGTVELKYQKVTATSIVHVGEVFKVERGDTVTILKRVNTTEFKVKSFQKRCNIHELLDGQDDCSQFCEYSSWPFLLLGIE